VPPRPLTEFSGNIRRELCIVRLAHQPQGLLDALLGDELEEWRLLELDRERLFQGIVKYSVPYRVGKVGQHNGVFLGELRTPMEIEESAHCKHHDHIDLETRVLEPLENPFGPKVSPM
jgi:hypothetical protein